MMSRWEKDRWEKGQWEKGRWEKKLSGVGKREDVVKKREDSLI